MTEIDQKLTETIYKSVPNTNFRLNFSQVPWKEVAWMFREEIKKNKGFMDVLCKQYIKDLGLTRFCACYNWEMEEVLNFLKSKSNKEIHDFYAKFCLSEELISAQIELANYFNNPSKKLEEESIQKINVLGDMCIDYLKKYKHLNMKEYFEDILKFPNNHGYMILTYLDYNNKINHGSSMRNVTLN